MDKKHLDFFDKLNENKMDFGLSRIKKVLESYTYGEYQNLKIIHVAGTNGKGSVSNFLSQYL